MHDQCLGWLYLHVRSSGLYRLPWHTRHDTRQQQNINNLLCVFVLFTVNKRKFDFNMSFQHGYGFYKISHTKSPSTEKPSYSNLFNYDLNESRVAVLDSGQIKTLANHEFRTTTSENSSLNRDVLLDATLCPEERPASQRHNSDRNGLCLGSPPPSLSGEGDMNLDSSSVFDGPERRLSHEDCRKIELADWEWCRSKSERTPRQVLK